jgi:hypothetical protein
MFVQTLYLEAHVIGHETKGIVLNVSNLSNCAFYAKTSRLCGLRSGRNVIPAFARQIPAQECTPSSEQEISLE